MLWLVNIIAYLVNAIVVGGSQLGWYGSTNEEVSEKFTTVVTPEGFAFSIWAVIFIGELVFVVWSALPDNREARVVNEGVGCWFAIACVLQAAWSVVFAQESLVTSAILLCAIAFSLGMAVVCLAPFKCGEGVLYCTAPFWAVHFPIGLHAGWTLAAALVNINLALELDNVTSEITAVILTAVGASFAASIAAIVFYDPIYLLSVTWATAGIAAKEDYRTQQFGAPVADGVTDALNALWVALLCVGVLGVFASLRERNQSSSPRREDKPRRRDPAGTDLTHAIFSS